MLTLRPPAKTRPARALRGSLGGAGPNDAPRREGPSGRDARAAPRRRDAAEPTAEATPFRILVVDDDRLMTEFLPRKLRKAMREDVQILTAATPEEARTIIETHQPHVVLSDYNLRETETGLDVLRFAAARTPDAARILFSGHTRDEILGIEDVEIHAYLEKPMKLDELVVPLLAIIRERTGRDVAADGGSGVAA